MIKSQRFYRYFMSYIFITVISLSIMSGVVYNLVLSSMSDEVRHSMVNSLDQFRNALDQRIQEMDRMAHQISNHKNLTPFKTTSTGYGSYLAIDELKQFLSTNRFISDIVIHYNSRKADTLYAASGTYEINHFFNDIFRFKHWDQDQFIFDSASISSPVMRPMDSVLVNQVAEQNYVVYSVPLVGSADTPYGTVMFLIPEESFNQLAANVLGDYNGSVYIFGEQSQNIYTFNRGTTNKGLMNALTSKMPGDLKPWSINQFLYQNKEYTVAKKNSSTKSYRYLAALPSDQIMYKVDQVKDIYNITVFAIFLFGVAFATALSVQNYKPLQKLMRVIAEQYPAVPLSPPPGKKDELEVISSAVANMIRENEGLIHQLHHQAIELREQFVLSLIRGKYKTREDINSYLYSANLPLFDPFFAVFLLYIDDYEAFRAEYSDAMQSHLKSSLMKVLEEAADGIGQSCGAELLDGRSMVFILNLKDVQNKEAILRQYAEQVMSLIRHYFRFTVTIGVGCTYPEVNRISQSFIEASHAARYRLMHGGSRIIYYPDIERNDVSKRSYPVEILDQLVKSIRQGDQSTVAEAVQKAMTYIKDQNMSVEIALFICFDIVNNVAKTLIELEIELDEAANESLGKLFVPHLETIEELERLITDICLQVCITTSSKKESGNTELLEQIKAFIDENYKNQSLSLKSIADQFGISASYATRFFKNQTGESLMRYIDGLRMQEAKQLLKTTELTLKDILFEVGYIDSTNFIRKFKRNEGLTPIQYRNLMN
ncbi:helix-turn-helix domain-containing protein [Paenibacillus dakarensis]|uniref:helix-turn-helix domain-containing protein n=1 Tax=Paenibacillus dakarensis TaxID=1527293 RepID=UPI0006D591C8|nr:helix-turn-helix domain-containing protein [Paenibacillus dakarensis]